MWRALPSIIRELVDDDSVSVVVVTGAGPDAFAAGADIEELSANADTAEAASAFMTAVQRAEEALAACPKPTIAMINGNCHGGGLELAMACDLRFAAVSSSFSVPPARLGVVYSLSSTRRLTQLIGPGLARDLLYSGRRFGSEEAHGMRLVERVLADEALETETVAYALQIARRSQLSVRAAKRIITSILDGRTAEDETLHQMRVDAMLSDDFGEGVEAFRERRPPEFPSGSHPL
jgi:enoyl-CoA hydratase/carnithine racemase